MQGGGEHSTTRDVIQNDFVSIVKDVGSHILYNIHMFFH
jgi:hypothetical protein